MEYDRSMIPELIEKARHERHRFKISHRSLDNWTPLKRAVLIIRFLRLGCGVADHPSGLLVNNWIIVAVARRRWRKLYTGQWHLYETPHELCKKLIARPARQEPVKSVGVDVTG